jgi:hypothetical protein
MGGQRTVCHQLLGHLLRQAGLDAPVDIDGGQLLLLRGGVLLELCLLARQIGFLGVRLRMDRDILARGHRHGAGHQPCDASQHETAGARTGSCDPEHQTGSRDDAVVGAQYGGPQPADALSAVTFCVAAQRSHGTVLSVGWTPC